MSQRPYSSIVLGVGRLGEAKLRARARSWAQLLGEDPNEVGKSIPAVVGLNMAWDELLPYEQVRLIEEFRQAYREEGRK